MRFDRLIVPGLGLVVLGALIARAASAPPTTAGAAQPAAAQHPQPPQHVPSRLDYGGRYDVTWSTSSTLDLPNTGPVNTAVDVDAQIDVFDAGERDGSQLFGLRIVHVNKASATAFGHDLLADPDAGGAALSNTLANAEVVLSVDRRGAANGVWVPKDATPLVKNLLHPLALHFAMSLPSSGLDGGGGTATWIATEIGDHGSVVWQYETDGTALIKVARESDVSGQGRVTFLSSGRPSAITMGAKSELHRGEKTLARANAHFEAKLNGKASAVEKRRIDVSNQFERHAPDEKPTSVDERAANLNLAAGMTEADIVAMIGARSMGQAPARGNVMRAAALLLAEPHRCDAIARAFQLDSTSREGRALAIDFLSSSGDAKAQTTMRELLASAVAKEDASLYAQLIQRFGLVAEPDAESITFVRNEWLAARKANDAILREATVYTLGSMALHARRGASASGSAAITKELLGRLRETRDEEEERGLVAAIGNDGAPETLDPILARGSAKDDRMRTQVATSLRKHDRADVRLKVVDLLADHDSAVALAAARSLDVMHIGAAELTRIAELIEGGRMHREVDLTIVGVVRTHHTAIPVAVRERIFRALRGRAAEDDRPELRDRVDKALIELKAETENAAIPPL